MIKLALTKEVQNKRCFFHSSSVICDLFSISVDSLVGPTPVYRHTGTEDPQEGQGFEDCYRYQLRK